MSFLKDIEKLAQPVFQLPDLEDEDIDGTSSKAVSKTKFAADDEVSTLRKKVIALDVDNSSKYGGTKISRDDIFDDFSGMAGLSDQPTAENEHEDYGAASGESDLDEESGKS
ncbi:unnamed protein product [Strongylus vulgaris]|uniref:Uncharacterized protein n=1 Tax=Strongylus vulgaris TaxID=40348 RepID=A0A3P7JW64_STRVU|nr:unnamed protein product [Strongylus vulgaris]